MEPFFRHAFVLAVTETDLVDAPYRCILRAVCRQFRREWPPEPLWEEEMDEHASRWARDGRIDLLRWFYDGHEDRISQSLPRHAAKGGRDFVLQWLGDCDVLADEASCWAAAENGHLDCLDWLLRRPHLASWRKASVCVAAAKGGRVDALKFLWSRDCCRNPEVYAAAAKHGHLDVLRFALAEGNLLKPRRAFKKAAGSGRRDVMEWLKENGFPWNEKTCEAAARHGHHDSLTWARENGCPWNAWTTTMLIGRGDLVMAEKILGEGCPLYPEMAGNMAARNGSIASLEWLLLWGYDCSFRFMETAAWGGHVAVLEWLLAHGFRFFSAGVVYNAALKGHLDVLRWLRSLGFSVPSDTAYFAIQSGSEECVSGLFAEGIVARLPDISETGFNYAAGTGRLAMVRLLWNLGFRRMDGLACVFAAKNGNWRMLRWLKRNGCPWNRDAVLGHASKSHTRMVRWIKEQQP